MKVIYSIGEMKAILDLNNKLNRKVQGRDKCHVETLESFSKQKGVTVTDDHVICEIPEGQMLKGIQVVDQHFDVIYGIAKSLFDLAQVFQNSLDSFGKALRDVFKD